EKKRASKNTAKKRAPVPQRKKKIKNTPAGGWWKPPPPAVFFKPTQLMTAGAVALIALGVLISWFAMRSGEGVKPSTPAQLQNRPPQNSPPDQKSPDSVAQASVDPQRPPQSGRDANDKPITFLLLASGTRGEQGDPPILKIPAQSDNVQLELELTNDDCAEFSAVLHSESNKTLQRWEKMRSRRSASSLRITSLRVRADSLKNNGYVIKLNCHYLNNNPITAVEYRFKVEKK